MDLLEFVEDGLGLVTGSLGDHVDEVFLQGLVFLGQGLFHLFAVDLEERHLDLLREALPHGLFLLDDLGDFSLDLIDLPRVLLHFDVPGEFIWVKLQ